MAEYIERENAYKLISEHIETETGSYSAGRNTGLNIAKSIIHSKEQCPTVDVVKVVRCKDCKNAYINSFSAQSGIALCKFWTNRANGEQVIMQQDDYCSYGELKEREENIKT